MTIGRSFIEYMQTVLNLGTFGDDLFLNNAPTQPDRMWWVVATGGNAVTKNQTGEKQKLYTLNVYFRSTNAQEVDEIMHQFEVDINTGNCDQLTGFDTIEMEAVVFPSDQDLDNEERIVGLVQVTIRSYL